MLGFGGDVNQVWQSMNDGCRILMRDQPALFNLYSNSQLMAYADSPESRVPTRVLYVSKLPDVFIQTKYCTLSVLLIDRSGSDRC